MCSYMIKVLETIPGLSPCYYFCNSKELTNICDQILRTIALQLLRGHLDLASLIANQFVYRGYTCGMAQLRNLIPQLLEIVPHTRIVIDGIDECSNESQRAIIKELQALCLSPVPHCKILFSSRKEVHIYEKLSGKPQIPLDSREEVESDIRLYVKYKIRQLRTSDADLMSRIESNLVEKANGENFQRSNRTVPS
jgi:hypothetical protein